MEFEAFSQSLRKRVPGLRDTGWAPRIVAAQRDNESEQPGFADLYNVGTLAVIKKMARTAQPGNDQVEVPM